MPEFQTLSIHILLFAALMIPGFLLGKCGKLKGATDGITNLLTHLAMPALVFQKIAETDLSSLPLMDALISLLAPILLIPLFYLPLKFLFKERSARFCALFSNCGFLGLPLAAALFPEQPQVSLYVALFNISSTFMMLTFGLFILSGNAKEISPLGAIFKPITFGVLAGIAVALLREHLPLDFLLSYGEYFSALTVPLAMLTLGAALSATKPRTLLQRPALWGVAAIKLVAFPLLTLALFSIFPAGSASCAAALFLSTGVSTAATAPALSEKYADDPEGGTVYTLGTTLFCLITLPLMSLIYQLFL